MFPLGMMMKSYVLPMNPGSIVLKLRGIVASNTPYVNKQFFRINGNGSINVVTLYGSNGILPISGTAQFILKRNSDIIATFSNSGSTFPTRTDVVSVTSGDIISIDMGQTLSPVWSAYAEVTLKGDRVDPGFASLA